MSVRKHGVPQGVHSQARGRASQAGAIAVGEGRIRGRGPSPQVRETADTQVVGQVPSKAVLKPPELNWGHEGDGRMEAECDHMQREAGGDGRGRPCLAGPGSLGLQRHGRVPPPAGPGLPPDPQLWLSGQQTVGTHQHTPADGFRVIPAARAHSPPRALQGKRSQETHRPWGARPESPWSPGLPAVTSTHREVRASFQAGGSTVPHRPKDSAQACPRTPASARAIQDSPTIGPGLR